jgi:signal transduction histidine kinase/FixJ family two-component response regulator
MDALGSEALKGVADTYAARNPWASLAPGIALVVGSIGMLALLGWVFDVPALRSILPRAVEMKPNTAVALILAAICLFLRSPQTRREYHLAVPIAALIVAAIGTLTLLEYAFGWQAHIDELLFRDTGNAYNLYRGRMSPYSAAALVAIGTALALPHRPRLRPLVLLGATATAAIGFASTVGYLWNARPLTTDQWLPPVAIHTAVAFVLLGLGAAFADHAQSQRRAAATDGGHGRVEAKVLIAFILALGLLCLGGGITYRMQVSFANSAQLLADAQQTRTELGAIYAAIIDAESVQRKYLLIGRVEYRDQYVALSSEVSEQIPRLRKSVLEEPTLSELERHLEQIIKDRLDTLSRHIAIFENQGHEAVRQAITAQDGTAAMEEIRGTIARMDESEAALSRVRSHQIAHDRNYTLIALVTTLLIATGALVVLFTSIVRDIRTRARIAQALDIAQQEARKATQAKSQFLATMSHEIRTPMNGIIGMLELLQQSSLLSQQMEMVKLTRESADSLLTIIDDILDFSKIEAGRLQVERLPFSVSDVVEKTCSLLNRLAERNKAFLTVYCDPDIPDVVLGDANRLRQVLINLINNAIKFCSQLDHPGRVCVRAELAELAADQGVVQFRVIDNGIGMGEETKQRLFAPFMQADLSTTRRHGGTGLGLAICKELVGLMGGSISVDTTLGRGSTFSVRLPFKLAEQPAASRPQTIQGLSCLVIGGQAGLADDLASYLRSEGAHVGRMAQLSGAPEWTRAQAPGLVLWVVEVGDELPVFDEVLPKIGSGTEPDVRVVLVVLGRGQRNPRAQADGFVMIDGNALNRSALVRAVAVAAGRFSADTEQPVETSRLARRPPATREDAIRQRRLILVAEDNEMNQRVIREQLNLLGFTVDVAPNGQAALQKWRSGEYALVFADIHMPEMDGYDLTLGVRLEEKDGRPRTPIIALTANALQGEAERCRAVGMDDYLSKPAPLAALAAITSKWLPVAPVQHPASGSPPPAPMDVRVLEALVGTDSEIIGQLLREFDITASRWAAELITAGRSRRPQEAAAVAHKLKSSARSVGATTLGELCAAIEAAGQTDQAEAVATLLPKFEAEIQAVQEYLRSTRAQEAESALSA